MTRHELVQLKQRIRADISQQRVAVLTLLDPRAILLGRKSLNHHQTGKEVFCSDYVV